MSGWVVPDYSTTRELGSGATGQVVLATHQPTGAPVAVKYLADELRSDREHLAQFRAEARLLCALTSPHIVQIFEYVEEPAGAAIVMELVNGVSLRTLLSQQGPTEPEAALCVLKGSLEGLSAAHAAGVMHRDFKPENVLVDVDGASKLADFGISSRSGRDTDGTGTPAYMSPEQWAGAPAGPGADIYAATATFVECLTGQPPYPGPGLDALRRQHERAPIPLDGVPAALHRVVESGLAKEPGRRPHDAGTLLAALDAAAGSGYGSDWEARGRRQLGRRVALLALLLPMAGGLTGGSAVATTALGRGAWTALTAGLIVVALAGGAGASAISGDDPVSDSSTTVVAGPDPSALTRPTAGPGVTPSQSVSPSPSGSTTPTSPAGGNTQPPPPAFKVLELSIVSFGYKDGGSSTALVTVHVVTSTTGPFTLNLRYAGSKVKGTQGSEGPVIIHPFDRSGSTSYDIFDSIDGGAYSCIATWFGVTASTTPTASTGTSYADLASPTC